MCRCSFVSWCISGADIDDVLLLQFLSLPKGKRLLCRAFGALDPAGRLSLAAAGMRLLPQFVASTARDQVRPRGCQDTDARWCGTCCFGLR